MLNRTTLPDKRIYETYSSASERNVRYNQLKAQWRRPELGQYESISGTIYFIIYKE